MFRLQKANQKVIYTATGFGIMRQRQKNKDEHFLSEHHYIFIIYRILSFFFVFFFSFSFCFVFGCVWGVGGGGGGRRCV